MGGEGSVEACGADDHINLVLNAGLIDNAVLRQAGDALMDNIDVLLGETLEVA